jgi:hypothetical protein
MTESRIQKSGVRIQKDKAEATSTDFLFFWLPLSIRLLLFSAFVDNVEPVC